MTDYQFRALSALHVSPLHAYEFYNAMYPGKTLASSSYGGPSREEKAAAWQLGKLAAKGWCKRRFDPHDNQYRDWWITSDGLAALVQEITRRTK